MSSRMSGRSQFEWIQDPRDGQLFIYDDRTDTLSFPGGRRIPRPQQYPRECFYDAQAYRSFVYNHRSLTQTLTQGLAGPAEPSYTYGPALTRASSYVPPPSGWSSSVGAPSAAELTDAVSRLALSQGVRRMIDTHLPYGGSEVNAQAPNARADTRQTRRPETTSSRLAPNASRIASEIISPAGLPGVATTSRDWASLAVPRYYSPPGESEQNVQGQQEWQQTHPGATTERRAMSQDENGVIVLRNSATRVQARFQMSPPEAITDPALLRHNVTAYQRVLGSGQVGDTETLFSTFKVRANPRKFFTLGKVFLVLWVQPAGESDITYQAEGTHRGKFGERVFSKVRRFVVIREEAMYCSALPIATYERQGVSKRGIKKSEHGIIHTGRQAPSPLDAERPHLGEIGMRPCAIRVDPDNPAEKLDPLSRINYGKIHTIEHNIKVQSWGKVNEKSIADFKEQAKAVWSHAMDSPEPTESNIASSSSGNQTNNAPAFQLPITTTRRPSNRSNDRRSAAHTPQRRGRAGLSLPSAVDDDQNSSEDEQD